MSQAHSNKHAILVSVGTDGDIYPFLGLGDVLRARGYRVTLATHEHFGGIAIRHGLEFRPVISNAETETLCREPNFWHPVKGPFVIARWGRQFVQRQFEVLQELVSGPNTLLIASPGVVAARVVQEKTGVPYVSVVLQPWIIPSVHAPPAMMGGLTLPRRAPRWIGRLYVHLFHAIGARLVGSELVRLRSSLGLGPMGRVFDWWHSPRLTVGMFPEWYASPQPDWPRQMKLAGFPVEDGQPTAEVPADVRGFCAAGSPPVAFTFGTGMMQAEAVFREGLEACRRMGARAILLTKFRSQLPADLPPFALHCGFAPFQKLFPLCGAVVHHGGIGTTAKALAAGVPQLILPFAFDQLDNGQRVRRLGAGDWLPTRQRKAEFLARALPVLLAPHAKARAGTVAERFRGSNGLEMAADLIGEMEQADSRSGIPSPRPSPPGRGQGENSPKQLPH